MRKLLMLMTMSVALTGAQLALAADEPTYRQIVETQVDNLSQPAANRFSSAQPSQEQLAALAAAGVKHIVSLRPASELDWDERAVVESLGMKFHNVPVSVPDGISQDNAEAFSQVLADIGDDAALLHCASGNRVGAMMALKHGHDTGDVETAVTIGKAWGMNMPGLENMVRNKLMAE